MPDDDRLLQEAALALKAQKHELDAADARIQAVSRQLAATQATAAAPKRAIPWRSLILGLVLILPVALLIGFAASAAARRPVPWPLALIPALLALVVAFFAVRYLWRFIRAVGPLRVLAAAAIVLLLATLLLIPFTGRNQRLSARAGDSLAQVLRGLENTVGVAPRVLAGFGSNLANAVTAPGAPVVNTGAQSATTAQQATVSAQGTPSPIQVVAQPSATAPPVPTTTATPRPQIRVGAAVLVNTEGVPLMGRAAATTDAEIVARFEDGATLVVIAVPKKQPG